MTERWIISRPGGPAGPFYGLVRTGDGRVIAMQIPEVAIAKRLQRLPRLEEACLAVEERCKDLDMYAQELLVRKDVGDLEHASGIHAAIDEVRGELEGVLKALLKETN